MVGRNTIQLPAFSWAKNILKGSYSLYKLEISTVAALRSHKLVYGGCYEIGPRVFCLELILTIDYNKINKNYVLIIWWPFWIFCPFFKHTHLKETDHKSVMGYFFLCCFIYSLMVSLFKYRNLQIIINRLFS